MQTLLIRKGKLTETIVYNCHFKQVGICMDYTMC